MKVLIMNAILYTAETDEIPRVSSIRDTMIYALCMGFVENGDTPVLLAAKDYKPVREEEYPFEILWLPSCLPRLFKPRCLPLLKGLGSYLREHEGEYDYIISSEVFSMLTLSGAIHAKKKLVIWHELGSHNRLLKKIPSRIWYHLVARLFMQNVPVVPRSARAKEFIRPFCNGVVNVTIDHGVDIRQIACCQEKEDYFVVVSQLIGRKHIDGIIRRFADFNRKAGGGYRLRIIGDGELRQELETLAKEEDTGKTISFEGKMTHEELVPILNRARALLVNTEKDNSMVSIVESIAAGTPVLTTSVPFNADYISKYSLGIVKDDWSAAELEEICRQNPFYVQNCVAYRERLSNEYCAKQFDQIGGALG